MGSNICSEMNIWWKCHHSSGMLSTGLFPPPRCSRVTLCHSWHKHVISTALFNVECQHPASILITLQRLRNRAQVRRLG